MEKSKHKVLIKPGNKEIKADHDQVLLDLLQQEGFSIRSICGGQGLCGRCWVKITEGAPEPTPADHEFFTDEELEEGIRLSCMIKVTQDMGVQIPAVSELVGSKELMNREIEKVPLDPGIEKTHIELSPPSRDDQLPDAERTARKIDRRARFTPQALRKLPACLRESDFKVTVTRDGENNLLDVQSGDKTWNLYGAACDIGTTTVAVYLMDLVSGQDLLVKSFENPQTKFGADVISRIKHVHDRGEEGLGKLQKILLNRINETVRDICTQIKIDPLDIYKATFVGNPTMLHLLAGVDPSNIDHSPYIPAFKSTLTTSFQDLGLTGNPLGKAYLLPQVSAYIGADTTAGILHTELHKSDPLKLLIDIGTNGEIVLGNKEEIIAASAAAGPAFEGAGIKQGMGARPGAVNHVNIKRGRVDIEVIGDRRPKGICGSGLVDAVGQLLKIDLINQEGGYQDGSPSPVAKERLKEMDGELSFNLGDRKNSVWLSQKDIRELQLAKGAIRAGIETLLEEMEVTGCEIETVYLAGAFGNYLNQENVLRLGILPSEIGSEDVISAGNTAGQGAKLCLLNMDKTREIEEISEKVIYEELSFRSDFSDKFMSALKFPPQSRWD